MILSFKINTLSKNMCDILLTRKNLDKVFKNQDETQFVWAVQHWDGEDDMAYVKNDNGEPNVKWLVEKVMFQFWNDAGVWYDNYNSYAGEPSPNNHIFDWEREDPKEFKFIMDLGDDLHYRIVFRNEKDSKLFFDKYNEEYTKRFYELYPEKK